MRSITVDQATGDVFAYDAAAEKIYKFDAAGAPVDFSATGSNAIEGVGGGFGVAEYQVAVAPPGSPGGTAGDIYVAHGGSSGTLKVFKASGEELTELVVAGGREVCGVAVSPTGELYVGVFGATIYEYTPSANPPTETDKTATGSLEGVGLCNVAVDGTGNVYAANYLGGEIAKLEGIADPSPTLIEGAPTIGVDPATNHLLADRGGLVAEYAAGGALLGTFGAGQLSESDGVAIDSAAEKVYVGEGASGKVKVFGAPAVIPGVAVEAADGITGQKATLHGTVNPSGVAVSECVFEYGTTPALGQSQSCSGAIPTDEADHPVTAALTGLSPTTTYYFKLSARNANGLNSSEGTFTTAAWVASEPATAVTDTSASLNGVVFPEGEAIVECFFEYGETEAYGSSTPCEQAVPADEGEHAVSAAITGLTPGGATYHFRLVVKRAGGEMAGADLSFQTKGAVVGAEQAGRVGLSEATLEASIDPRGSLTSYRFEYGTGTNYGSATPEVALGEGEGFQTVTETITGLTPGTTYHWRVVAIDPFGTHERLGPDRTFTTYQTPSSPQTDCPNQAFRTSTPSAGLPDCRAYEQASPVDKNGADIQKGLFVTQAAIGGDRVTFADVAGLSTSTPGINFVASRSATGWTTQSLTPLVPPNQEKTFLGWDEEIDHAASGVFGEGIHLLDSATGEFELTPFALEAEAKLDGFAGTDADFIFETKQKLTPEAPDEGALPEGASNLYDLDHGSLSLVGLVPPAGSDHCDAAGGGEPCEVSPEGVLRQEGATQFHPISEDGRYEFFTAAVDRQLYVREDGTASTRVSAPRGVSSDPNGTKPAAFDLATPSGSEVLFTSCEKLTPESTATSTGADSCTETEGGQALEGQDLYAYDPGSGSLQDLTTHLEGANSLGAAVVGVLGASKDGSYVYFAANGVLAPGATPGNCAVPGASGSGGNCNIYLWHEGNVSLVTRITEGNGEAGEALGVAKNWTHGTIVLGSDQAGVGPLARVSATGALLFVAPESFATPAGSGFSQLFRYEPGANEINCVSCAPTGVPATSDAHLAPAASAFGTTPKVQFLSRNLSADGDEVFFDTQDRLVPADTDNVSDVYEWEAPGSGSCHSASEDGGCLYLLSADAGEEPAFFADASASGSDVFFFTARQLVPGDKDNLVDVYDARVEGGLASQYATGPASPCASADTCHGPVSQSAPGTSPGTPGFQGPGNLTPPVIATTKKTVRKALTRKQKLATALKACRTEPKRKRVSCERAARKGFGSKHKAKPRPNAKKKGGR
ncbi:MAG TPA: hypothetical protein VIH71_04875 [Solirubrobacteraceae bacterium]